MVAFYLCGDVLNVKHVLLGPVRNVKIVIILFFDEVHCSFLAFTDQVGVETNIIPPHTVIACAWPSVVWLARLVDQKHRSVTVTASVHGCSMAPTAVHVHGAVCDASHLSRPTAPRCPPRLFSACAMPCSGWCCCFFAIHTCVHTYIHTYIVTYIHVHIHVMCTCSLYCEDFWHVARK